MNRQAELFAGATIALKLARAGDRRAFRNMVALLSVDFDDEHTTHQERSIVMPMLRLEQLEKERDAIPHPEFALGVHFEITKKMNYLEEALDALARETFGDNQ